jgi:energy-coupling factor transporter ATP-binding protein EcfA2
MRIIRFEAENIKKLKCVQIVPDGSVVQITGPNASGKTSVLDAIFWALAGTKEMPEQPIRKGEKKAMIKLDLGEVVVTRKLTPNSNTLTVEAANGAKFPSPQKMLDELLGKLTFDPLAFTRMDAKGQLAALRDVVKLDVDVDKLQRDSKIAFDQRADFNRTVKSLEAQVTAIVYPDDTPAEKIDVAEILAEMDKAEEHNQVELQKERDAARRRDEIDRHKLEIERAKQELAAIQQRIANETGYVAALEKMDNDPIPDVIDKSVLRKKLSDSQEINGHVVKRQQREKLVAQLNETRDSADALTRLIEGNEKQRREAFERAKMPVPGLVFGEDGIFFNDLPLNQASDAEQLRVSMAIAMAANPKLRVLRIRDGSLLDENSLALVEKMADAEDFQVWMEIVRTDSKVGVVMEDGEVKSELSELD